MTSPANLRGLNIRHLLIDETDASKPFPAEGDPIALGGEAHRGLPRPSRHHGVDTNRRGDGLHLTTLRPRRSADLRDPLSRLRYVFRAPLGTYYLAGRPVAGRGRQLPALRCGHRGEGQAPSRRGRPVAGDKALRGNHASFRLNALISTLANARWGLLAEEYLQAQRDGPARLQVFENTTLGISSTASLDTIDPSSLVARLEPFGLNNLPPEVLDAHVRHRYAIRAPRTVCHRLGGDRPALHSGASHPAWVDDRGSSLERSRPGP